MTHKHLILTKAHLLLVQVQLILVKGNRILTEVKPSLIMSHHHSESTTGFQWKKGYSLKYCPLYTHSCIRMVWNISLLLLVMYPPKCTRAIHSSSETLLNVPKSATKTYGDRAFSVAGPSLACSVKDCQTVDTFKKHLKTHLFKAAFC